MSTNVVSLAAGDKHCLALMQDGTITAWGSIGQAKVPPLEPGAVAIAAGSTHSLALKSDGTLALWGRLYGTATSSIDPEATNVASLAIGPGSQHAAVLRRDGKVITWGAVPKVAPLLRQVPASSANFVSLAAGATHMVGLRADGSVVAWGDNSYNQTNVPSSVTNIVAIATGWQHSAAVRADGRLFVWGNGISPLPSYAPYTDSNFAAVACGSDHVAALTREGKVVVYAPRNAYKEKNVPAALTNASALEASSFGNVAIVADGPPVFLAPVIDRTVVSGATAFLKFCAVGKGPFNYQWNFEGIPLEAATNAVMQVKNAEPSKAGLYTLTISNSEGTNTSAGMQLNVLPVFFTERPQNKAAYSAEDVVFKAKATGTQPIYYFWSWNGQPIIGATNSSLSLTNVNVESAGMYSVTVSNQFGTATSEGANLTVEPIVVTTQQPDKVWFRGGMVTFAVSAVSSAEISYQWRFDGTDIPGATTNTLVLSQLRDEQSGVYTLQMSNHVGLAESAPARLSVVPVAAWGFNATISDEATNYAAVSAGWDSLALCSDGTIRSWGRREGIATNPPPADLTSIIAISAGSDHQLALKADGTVVGWGKNVAGETQAPAEATNVVAISAGYAHSMALTADGRVLTWGRSRPGQEFVLPYLTNIVAISAGEGGWDLALRRDGVPIAWGGSGSPTNVPADLTNVIGIAAGFVVGIALREDGTVRVWGSNGYGIPNIPESATNIVKVKAGYGHCVVLTQDGHVLAWGYGYNGETNIPTGLENVIDITAGSAHNLALIGSHPRPLQVLPGSVRYAEGVFEMTVPSSNGRVYSLEYKDSLESDYWVALPLVAGTGSELKLSDKSALPSTRYYRVRRW